MSVKVSAPRDMYQGDIYSPKVLRVVVISIVHTIQFDLKHEKGPIPALHCHCGRNWPSGLKPRACLPQQPGLSYHRPGYLEPTQAAPTYTKPVPHSVPSLRSLMLKPNVVLTNTYRYFRQLRCGRN